MNKGDVIELKIEDMTEDGKGIGKFNSLAIFVSDAVIGDFVKAEIIKLKKRYAIARLIEVLKPSSDRINPSCEYFGICGGCSLLNLRYEKQVELKRNMVKEKLARLAGITGPVVREVIAAEQPTGYRNKARYSIGSNGEVGFYKRKSSEVIDCKTCQLQNEASIKVANCIRGLIKEGIINYKKGEASSLRAFTVKACKGSGEVMLILEIIGKELDNAEEIVYAIEDSLIDSAGYKLKSVALALVSKNGKHSEIDKLKIVAGRDTITDEVTFKDEKSLKFEISPASFYQINTEQMVALYEKAEEYANLRGDEILLDIYCGTGTIGLSMADKAGFVLGIESVKDAILNANRNASINGIVNAIYYHGKAEDCLDKAIEKLEQILNKDVSNIPKVAIIDPPRAGADEKLLEMLAKIKPDRIVYISCDAGTLARDIKYLELNGYDFIEATPVEMFPNTMSIESVSLLSLSQR